MIEDRDGWAHRGDEPAAAEPLAARRKTHARSFDDALAALGRLRRRPLAPPDRCDERADYAGALRDRLIDTADIVACLLADLADLYRHTGNGLDIGKSALADELRAVLIETIDDYAPCAAEIREENAKTARRRPSVRRLRDDARFPEPAE